MKLTKKLEAEIKQVMNDYWDSYFKGDLQHWATYLVNDYRNIGGTEEEIWNSKKEILDYTHRIVDQMEGVTELRNKQTQIIPYDPYFMVHELLDIYIKIEAEWTFYQKFRLSSLIQKNDGEWKVLHQHGSYPDSKTLKGEAFAFDEIKAENIRLLEAVKNRTIELENKNRELEIEAALERIRAVAMSMMNADDLLEVSKVQFNELKQLGFTEMRNALIGIFYDAKNYFTDYDYSDYSGGSITQIPYHKNLVVDNAIKRMKSATDAFTEFVVEGKELEEWKAFRKQNGEYDDIRINETASLYYYFYSIESGNVGISTFKKINEEQLNILKRFRNVFDLAYSRYVDINNAAAQTREAQIELGLERVRARAMAMQQSDELKELIGTVYAELTKLNISLDRCLIWVMNSEDLSTKLWMAGAGALPVSFYVPYHENPPYLAFVRGWKERNTKWEYDLGGQIKKDWDEFVFSNTEMKHLPGPVKKGMQASERIIMAGSFQQFGCLQTAGPEPLNNEQFEVLNRFAKVFDSTYTRFNDLQKAEAQAREAKIEVSLERVRSRAMAMHKTDELLDAGELVYKELNMLGITSMAVSYAFVNEEEKNALYYGINPVDGKIPPVPFVFPHTETEEMRSVLKSWKKQETFKMLELDEEATLKHQTWVGGHIQTIFAKNNIPFSVEEFLAVSPQTAVIYTFHFTQGYIFIIGEERLSAMQEEMVLRFTKVFEMTYRRFLDLQKAEANARESRIEASLERVRSKAMGMHRSEDLALATATVFEELERLNLGTIRCGIGIINRSMRRVATWAATLSDNGMAAQVSGNESMDIHPLLHGAFEAWTRQEDYSHLLQGEELHDFYKVQAAINFNLPESQMIVSGREDLQQYYFCAMFPAGGLYAFRETAFPNEAKIVMKRFADVFNLTYTRFNDLQQAEAQAKEAKIELALERIRARTMAMHKSDELPEAANLLFLQVQALGMPAWSAGYCIWDEDKKGITLWMSSEGVLQPPARAPLTEDPSFIHMREAYERGESFFVEEIGGEELVAHYKYMRTLPVVGEILDSIIEAGHPLPTFQIFHLAYFSQGFLLFITYEPVPGAHEIFKRFGKVFDQTYTRFLDLQKAEAQAKEVQIELGLERVRARAMAMQNSEDVSTATATMFNELDKLGIENLRCGILIGDESQFMDVWSVTTANNEKTIKGTGRIDMNKTPLWQIIHKSWKQKTDFLFYPMAGEEKNQYYKTISNLSGYSLTDSFRDMPDQFAQSYFFGEGLIWTFSLHPHSEAEKLILKKFTAVFSLTFRRYLDLKQAEAQAREAKIEAALEKVRSRTMGMQKSEELKEVIQVVYDQFIQLNINVEHTGFILDYKASDDMHIWLADRNKIPAEITFPYFDCAYWNSFNEAKEKGRDFFANHLSFEEKNKFYRDLFKLIPGLPEEILAYYLSCSGLAISTVLLENVGLYIENFSGIPYSDEENNTLMRFGKVFQQTYTRFLDLQKAEAQSRESQIELGLERVRARAMAMQKSDELAELVDTVFKELTKLDFALSWCMINIIDEPSMTNMVWGANPVSGKAPESYHMKFEDYRFHHEFFKAWKEKQAKWVFVLKGQEKEIYDEYLFTQTEFKRVPEPVQKEMRATKQHVASFTFSNFGGLQTVGEKLLSEQNLDILGRFGKVFDLTYTRFNDLLKAEAQSQQAEQDLIAIKEAKQKAEDALTELQATQKQLIQSEKMASLGELTAGIAHEIQNPLNFVNNFSEVSTELVDEMNEEMAKGNIEDAKQIAQDLKQNLEKINHHGKRAGDIVKGMLQHSRSSSGVKEPTDINALCDEYLRLSYHGLRAKDKSFNATMKTDFDASIGNINIIPQDIGRVIMNLLTNAFYAVNERKKQAGDAYDPTVSVSTSRSLSFGEGWGEVTIKVTDNGNGIPQKVLDKIFQPFFTTKPTGQGTGLGLSLSYDIVKAHGGELKVETKEGEGSVFILHLPTS